MSGIKKQDGPVAVTGASGYIGSRIVEDLLQQGYEAVSYTHLTLPTNDRV